MAITVTNGEFVTDEVTGITSIKFKLPENLGDGTIVSEFGTDSASETVKRVIEFGQSTSVFRMKNDNGVWKLVFHGDAQDFESKPDDYSLTFVIEKSETFADSTVKSTHHTFSGTISISDVDEKPTEILLTNDAGDPVESASVNESTRDNPGKAVKLANITIKDDGLGTGKPKLKDNNDIFEIKGDEENGWELWLKAGKAPSFEDLKDPNNPVKVTIFVAEASGEGPDPEPVIFKLNVLDVQEPVHFVDDDDSPVTEYKFSVDEDISDTDVIGTIKAVDPDGKALLYYSISGDLSDSFDIDAVTGAITLIPNGSLDFENMASHTMTIEMTVIEPNNPEINEHPVVPVTIQVNNVLEEGEKHIEIVQMDAAKAGKSIGKVKFGAKDAVYTVYDNVGGDGGASDLFIVNNDGQLVLKSGATLPTHVSEDEKLTYTVAVKTGTGGEALAEKYSIRVNHIISEKEAPAKTFKGEAEEIQHTILAPDEFDGDELTFVVKQGGVKTANGSYTVRASTTLNYSPNDDFTGIDEFEVDVSDGYGGFAKAKIKVTVDSIIGITGTFTASEDNPFFDPAGQIIMADTDRTGYSLSVNDTSITTDATSITASYGTLKVNKDGTWTYDLDNSNAVVEALDGDDDDTDGAKGTLTETITVTMARADDETTSDINEAETLTESFTITINGRTDVYLTADQSSYSVSNTYEDYTIHASKTSSLTYQNFYSLHGSDVLEGNDLPNQIYARRAFDILNGYGGDDRLGSTGGSDIINGGEGSDTSLYLNRFISDVNVDLADPVKWKYNRATGEWESGSGEGYTYIRATYRHEYDDDGDGVYDDFRIEHDYMTSIENLEASANGSVRGVVSNNVFSGDAKKNILSVSSSNSVMDGRDGNDEIYGGYKVDKLIGGKGADLLCGGGDNDIFVLYQGAHATGETNRDAVIDFSSGIVSGHAYYNGTTRGGNDKIRVDTALGTETTLASLKAALNIRWTNTSNFDTGTTYNDKTLNDTVIYATHGTASTADDIVIMVLEDYTAELTMTNFEVV
ncbi:cadherin-like domain-containing protein [Alphaproteobacteria bacterium LSUCC0684]